MRVTTQTSGGNRLQQRMADIRKRLQKNSGVRVGVPASAGQTEDGISLAGLGAVHEFGSADGHIPERSFLRVPLRSNRDKFAAIFKNQVPLVVRGDLTMRQFMDQLGASAAGVSQEAISAGISPANAESTIERKGSSTPLVDTGRLRQSITWEVEGDEQ